MAGSFDPDGALLSAEAARNLKARPGDTVDLRVPGSATPLSLPVSGVVDLSDATPLFSSRKTSKLEDFIYVPDAVVVSPKVFEKSIIPAFQAATATRGNELKSFPNTEIDVLVDRSRLQSDPARAFAQTTSVARAINRVAPGQDYLIDNISNALQVARDDAAVGKRMFVFLGLPGVLLAAFLAGYAGSVLASAQRREQATLRIRGAHRGHLRRMLAYKTVALAGAGSVLGVALGFVAVIVILGSATLFEASTSELVTSACIGAGVGMLVTAIALYLPGRLALGRDVSQERREVAASTVPLWQRWRIDFLLLGAAVVAEVVALRSGAFDAAVTSVSAGEAASLPSHLLLAPLHRVARRSAPLGSRVRGDRVAASGAEPGLRPRGRWDPAPQPAPAVTDAGGRDRRCRAGHGVRSEHRDLRGDVRRRQGRRCAVRRSAPISASHRASSARDPIPLRTPRSSTCAGCRA